MAFDPNYRPRLWPDPETARTATVQFAKYVAIALPTFSDEHALFGDSSPEAVGDRWLGYGASECAVKLGAEGCLIASQERFTRAPGASGITPRDTTGAGDAFNAAYLDARLRGSPPAVAGAHGNGLASQVIQFAGALIPGNAMTAARSV